MRRIRSKDTVPELVVRRLAHAMGYRYRLHRKDLPGKPDMTFSTLKKVVFVHGCFWHQHSNCADGRVPGSNRSYWLAKLQSNVSRDTEARRQLKDEGWQTLVVWECETKNLDGLAAVLKEFLQ